jgi:histone H3/H4
MSTANLTMSSTKPAENPVVAKRKHKRVRNYDKLDSFIVAIARQFSYDAEKGVQFNVKESAKTFGVTSDAMRNLDSMLKGLLEQFVGECVQLTRMTNSKTIGVREIQTAIRLYMADDLSAEVLAAIKKTIETYTSDANQSIKNHTLRAGLHIPVRRIANMIRSFSNDSLSVAKLAPVAASAMLEFLTHSILGEACAKAHDMNRQRITPQHLLFALHHDAAIQNLFIGKSGILGHQAGVIPFIASELQKKK